MTRFKKWTTRRIKKTYFFFWTDGRGRTVTILRPTVISKGKSYEKKSEKNAWYAVRTQDRGILGTQKSGTGADIMNTRELGIKQKWDQLLFGFMGSVHMTSAPSPAILLLHIGQGSPLSTILRKQQNKKKKCTHSLRLWFLLDEFWSDGHE